MCRSVILRSNAASKARRSPDQATSVAGSGACGLAKGHHIRRTGVPGMTVVRGQRPLFGRQTLTVAEPTNQLAGPIPGELRAAAPSQSARTVGATSRPLPMNQTASSAHPQHCLSCGQPVGYWSTDKLTGLLDRWGWDDEAEQILRDARRQGHSVSLLIIDLDYFKRVNDELGHLAGDTVLRFTAMTIRSAIRSHDLAGRYGGHAGDEFLVLLPGVGVDVAVALAERVRVNIRTMRLPFRDIAGATVEISGQTASIGLAGGSLVHGTDLHTLLLQADSALREAKRHGRDQIWIASPAGIRRPFGTRR
jgi:diguanylate cyclase (GGDEF)-like protein